MEFDLKKTGISLAINAEHLFPKEVIRLYRLISFCVAIISILGWLVTQLLGKGFYLSNTTYQGIFYLSLSLAVSLAIFELFVYFYLKHPPIKDLGNIGQSLSFGLARSINRSAQIASVLGENEITPTHVMLAVLKDRSLSEAVVRVPKLVQVIVELRRQSGPLGKIKDLAPVRSPKYSKACLELFESAYNFMKERGGERITTLDILVCLFDFDDGFKRIILNSGLDKTDLIEISYWYEHIWAYRQKVRKFWSLDNLYRRPPVGKDWVFGFLPYLNAFGTNLTLKFKYSALPFKLMSRTKEIKQLEETLVRSGENNVILVGLEGVGKDRLIDDFAEMVAHGRALPALNYKNIFRLNLQQVLAYSKTASDIQNTLLAIFNEAVKAGNVIIIIDDIHNYAGQAETLGHVDISEIMIPYLKSSRVQLITTTDMANYHKFIEAKSDMAAVFERVDVSEPDKSQTLRVLEEKIPQIEHNSGVLITYAAMHAIVDDADKFITSSPFPEKAIDLLGQVVSHVVSNGLGKVVTEKHVQEVVTLKTGVPLGNVTKNEKDKLDNFESLMRKELVGQERAIEVVSSTLRRLRAGLAKRGRPAGVFLFVGPTGVGKTQTAKILARTYFGSENKMLRFDMSEFQAVDSIDRFLGNLKTNEPGQFISAVKDNPFSLILLDEVEKANKNLLNIFLQVFDEGHLTDVFSRKISFEQNIIIATSNAGASSIRDLVIHGVDPAKEKDTIIDIIIKEGHFSPEFLNRFDEVVVFHPLLHDEVREIADILLSQLAQRLSEQGYVYEPTKEIAEYISREGFDPQFGARPMQRVVRDKLESAIAKKILDGELEKGVPFSLTENDLM